MWEAIWLLLSTVPTLLVIFLNANTTAIMTSGDRIIANSRFIAGHMRRIYGVPVK